MGDGIKQAFVTGGSGFLGRNLLRSLVGAGYGVRALARSPSSAATVTSLGAKAAMGDLSDADALRTGMEGSDVVFHLAALVGERGHRDEFELVNISGTENVLRAANDAGVSKLVYASTEAVLLDGSPLINVEESRARPSHHIGPYAHTKAVAEGLVLAASSNRLQTCAVRPRWIWGPGDTSVLPLFAAAVAEGRFAWIAGGRYLTSTCNVGNACEGLLLAADRGEPGGVYFVTDGEPVEFRAFLTALLATRGIVPSDRSMPRWVASAVAHGGDSVWRALNLSGAPPLTLTALSIFGREVTVSDSRARSQLGYRALVSREKGLELMSLEWGQSDTEMEAER